MCREVSPDLRIEVLSHKAVLLPSSNQLCAGSVARVEYGSTWQVEVV